MFACLLTCVNFPPEIGPSSNLCANPRLLPYIYISLMLILSRLVLADEDEDEEDVGSRVGTVIVIAIGIDLGITYCTSYYFSLFIHR